jgi:hypothetical protein
MVTSSRPKTSDHLRRGRAVHDGSALGTRRRAAAAGGRWDLHQQANGLRWTSQSTGEVARARVAPFTHARWSCRMGLGASEAAFPGQAARENGATGSIRSAAWRSRSRLTARSPNSRGKCSGTRASWRFRRLPSLSAGFATCLSRSVEFIGVPLAARYDADGGLGAAASGARKRNP